MRINIAKKAVRARTNKLDVDQLFSHVACQHCTDCVERVAVSRMQQPKRDMSRWFMRFAKDETARNKFSPRRPSHGKAIILRKSIDVQGTLSLSKTTKHAANQGAWRELPRAYAQVPRRRKMRSHCRNDRRSPGENKPAILIRRDRDQPVGIKPALGMSEGARFCRPKSFVATSETSSKFESRV